MKKLLCIIWVMLLIVCGCAKEADVEIADTAQNELPIQTDGMVSTEPVNTQEPISSAEPEVEEVPLDMQIYQERNQDQALSDYEELNMLRINNKIKKDENSSSEGWPGEYAGCYINDDDILVICLTENTEEMQAKYIEACGETIAFQSAEFSVADMEVMVSVLEDYFESNDDENIDMWAGYNNEHNKIRIYTESQNLQADIENYVNELCKSDDFEHKELLSRFSDMVEFLIAKFEPL